MRNIIFNNSFHSHDSFLLSFSKYFEIETKLFLPFSNKPFPFRIPTAQAWRIEASALNAHGCSSLHLVTWSLLILPLAPADRQCAKNALSISLSLGSAKPTVKKTCIPRFFFPSGNCCETRLNFENLAYFTQNLCFLLRKLEGNKRRIIYAESSSRIGCHRIETGAGKQIDFWT